MKGPLLMATLLVSLASFSGAAENAIPAKGMFPYAYQEKVLDNQLKVILIPMESPGLVSYYSIVRTGSRDEYEPGHTGFAHFFEHMMFRGTKTFPGNVYDRMMTEMGADANAYTSEDYTCYHINMAKEDLETVMKLESDRFQNLWYEEQAFKTEAGAVHGEYLKGLSSPWSNLNEKLLATAFTAHTYRHRVIGFKQDIEAMPAMYQYSLSFYRRYYRPENTVLLIVGDIDPAATFDKVTQYYGAWPTGYVPPTIPKEPAQTAERLADVSFQGQTLPIVVIAYKGIAFDPQNIDQAANDLLADLAFGETSEIYKKLVIDEQRVQYIGADFSSGRDPGLLSIATMVNDEKDIDAIIAEIDKVIDGFQKQPVSEQKLADQRSHNKYRFLLDLDTPDKVAGRLAGIIALTGDIKAIDERFATFDRVTPQDILSAAQKYCVKSTRTIVVLKGGRAS
jgi:zinc protease